MKKSEEVVTTVKLLTKAETAELLRVSIATLDNWHRKGAGPRRIALSPRDIRYRDADIRAWIDGK